MAYVHYISFMVCFAALVTEASSPHKPAPDRREATSMAITGVVHGLAALALLASAFYT